MNFKKIYESSNTEKMNEGVGTVIAGVIIATIGFKVLGGLVKAIVNLSESAKLEKLKNNAVEALYRKLKEEAFDFIQREDVESLIEEHKDEFEKLSAEDSATLFEKLIAKKYPKEYENFRYDPKTREYMRTAIKNRFEGV
jgi:hypothetical protein